MPSRKSAILLYSAGFSFRNWRKISSASFRSRNSSSTDFGFLENPITDIDEFFE